MSEFSDSRRAEVASRADHRCEYCRLTCRGQVATFPIDHIQPKSLGGSNSLDNLALACPHCNAHKWADSEGLDAATSRMAQFFNPRRDRWSDHFEWSATRPGELIGRTPIGRVTIDGLRINDTDMIALRLLLAELGLFTEIADRS